MAATAKTVRGAISPGLGLCSAQRWVVTLWQLKVSWREAIHFLSVCKMACKPWGFSWVKMVVSYWAGNLLRSGRSRRRDVCSRRGQNQKVLFAKWAQQIIFDCPVVNGCPPPISNGTELPWISLACKLSCQVRYN